MGNWCYKALLSTGAVRHIELYLRKGVICKSQESISISDAVRRLIVMNSSAVLFFSVAYKRKNSDLNESKAKLQTMQTQCLISLQLLSSLSGSLTFMKAYRIARDMCHSFSTDIFNFHPVFFFRFITLPGAVNHS